MGTKGRPKDLVKRDPNLVLKVKKQARWTRHHNIALTCATNVFLIKDAKENTNELGDFYVETVAHANEKFDTILYNERRQDDEYVENPMVSLYSVLLTLAFGAVGTKQKETSNALKLKPAILYLQIKSNGYILINSYS